MKIYALYDKIANRFLTTTLAESDQMFVRTALSAILMDYALADIQFYCVGDFDNELGIIKPCKPRLCDWECYRFPETRANREKYLTIEQIDELAKNKKHDFLKKTKDQVKDLENFLSQIKAALKLEEDKKKKDKEIKLRIKELRELINQTSDEIKNLKEVTKNE